MSIYGNFLNSQKANVLKQGLFYGNPTRDQVNSMVNLNEDCKAIMQSGILNKYYNIPWQGFMEPGNKVAKTEIEAIIAVQSSLTKEDIDFINKCEEDIAGVWLKALKKIEIPKIEKSQLQEFIDLTDGILYHLKYHYQRPRPLQMAYFYGLKLYPVLATNANSPSYPGGHAFDAYRVAYLLAKKYPEKAMELLGIADAICMSRVKGGVHYPSDNIMSHQMAKELVAYGFFDKYL
jgi:hypothetical protein